MGNVVTGEALLEGANVDNYVMMQAAISATCYDGSTGLFIQEFVDKDAEPDKHTPLDASQMGYRLYLSGVGVNGNIVNFYNTNDFALAKGTFLGLPLANWEHNNLAYKPDTDYVSDGTNSWYTGRWTPRHVTDVFESMAFVSRSRSKAVGAEPGTAGPINTARNVDLTSPPLRFGDTRPDHSGQFTRNIQIVLPFYDILLSKIEP